MSLNQKQGIGAVLARERKALGMSQGDVGSFVGVTKAAVSKWELGLSLPEISLLPRLAALFSVSVDELIGYRADLDFEEIQEITAEAWMRLHEDFDVAIKWIDVTAKDHYACAELLISFVEMLISALECYLATTEDERRRCGALAYEYGARAKACARDAATALTASRLCKAMESEDTRHIANWALYDVPPMAAHEAETGVGDLFIEMFLEAS